MTNAKSISLFAMSLLGAAVACGSDDDDGGLNGTGGSSVGGQSGGSAGASTGGSGGSGGSVGGSAGSATGGSAGVATGGSAGTASGGSAGGDPLAECKAQAATNPDPACANCACDNPRSPSRISSPRFRVFSHSAICFLVILRIFELRSHRFEEVRGDVSHPPRLPRP